MDDTYLTSHCHGNEVVTCKLKAPFPESFSWIPSTMAPAIRLALSLLLFPALIISEPLHVPLSLQHQTKSMNWAHEANKLRQKYGYSIPPGPSQIYRSNRRATADIPMLDQVHIFLMLFCFKLTHYKRVLILSTLLIWRLAHHKLHIFLVSAAAIFYFDFSIPILTDLTGPSRLRSFSTPDHLIYGYRVKIVLLVTALRLLDPPFSTHQNHPHSKEHQHQVHQMRK